MDDMTSKGLREPDVQLSGAIIRRGKSFESEQALLIIEELYPLLLENCTDEEDEVDTRAVLESLSGMVGLFMADYQEGYGHESSMTMFQDLIDLAMNAYEQHAHSPE